ncbi:MAG: right-handed parallel beta-helix repeat-containing protein [bacterium]
MKKYVVILLAAMIFTFQAGCAKIIYVSQTATGNQSGEDWNNACASITQALTAAKKDPDLKTEIWVAAGQYRETIAMRNKVKIFGGFSGTESNQEDRNWLDHVTIIDGTGLESSTVSAVGIGEADSQGYITELNGFTIQGSSKSGIYCSNASPNILNCIITANAAPEGGGIYCDRSSPLISFCAILHNTAEKGAGVYCNQSSPRITKSVLAMNTATSGGGLYCQNQSFPGLINCTLADNAGSGIECGSSAWVRLLNCIVWNPGIQIAGENAASSRVEYTCLRNGWAGLGNIAEDPLFVNDQTGDYHLQPVSPCVDAGHPDPLWNDEKLPPGLGSARCDMGAYGGTGMAGLPLLFTDSGILHVRADAAPGGNGSSWETALPSINAAIALQNYGEIWVAQGRYHESVQLKSDVAVYGGFAGSEKSRDARDWLANETIIDASGLENSAVVGANRALLDGFTVTGGNESRIKCTETSPTVMHCTITSSASLTNGSGVLCERSSPLFSYCIIAENHVKELEGGGVQCSGLGSPKFLNCVIEDNSATKGGGIHCFAATTPLFMNCIIARNTATEKMDNEPSGGGMHFVVEPPTLINCVITGNHGTGIVVVDDKITIINSIIWNNSDKAIFVGENMQEKARVSYSCIEGGWPGEGNIDADPLFMDPENGDYHLQNGSPCIDAGLVAKAPNEDVEGRGRPGSDGLVDMGAYESMPEYSAMVYVTDWEMHD